MSLLLLSLRGVPSKAREQTKQSRWGEGMRLPRPSAEGLAMTRGKHVGTGLLTPVKLGWGGAESGQASLSVSSEAKASPYICFVL